MEFTELAFRRLDDRPLKCRAYIDWAEQLLEEGSESSSVAQLASCSWEAEPDPNQVEQLFQSCLVELGLSVPADWYQALLAYTSSICQKFVQGTLDSWSCMTEMLELAEDNNDPYILWIWIDLASDLSRQHVIEDGDFVFNGSLDLENQDACIRRTASQFVALCSKDLPLKFPWVWWCKECREVSDETTFSEIQSRTCPTCGSAHSMKNMRFFENREEIAWTVHPK